MPQAKLTLGAGHPYEEFLRITDAAWRRALRADNTPQEAQMRFEYDAILKAAQGLYEQRLLEWAIQ